MKRTVSAIFMAMLLTSMLCSAFKIMPVGAVGTIYIRADGSVDPSGAPIQREGDIYTLTGNITSDADGIVIERDNMTLDGATYTVQGTGSGNGINLWWRSNVTIKNMKIKIFEYGIWLENSPSNDISTNNITNNNCGIVLSESSNNVFKNNAMAGNLYNFGVYGSELSYHIHDVDVSNTVDGKPMYYLINQTNLVINPSTYPNIGYLALVNSTNITVEGYELKNNYQGILFAYTTNSQIINNNITKNNYGIYLSYSLNNSISGNKITSSIHSGVYVDWYSNNNTLSRNNITNNGNGIYLHYSSNYNVISRNEITDNSQGIHLYHSSDNMLFGNNITNNYGSIQLEWESNDNKLSGNTITNSRYGIDLIYSSNNNSISRNNITNNYLGIYLDSSSDNSISGNNIANNGYGIWLDSSSNNRFYHNNFIDNTQQVHIYTTGYANVWDDGYPSGGNYWSDFNPPDVFSGAYQNETGSDKIGDTPYIIDAENADSYPLIYPYGYVPSPDFNNDGIIDIFDIVRMALAFGSVPGMPNWDPYVDLNQDGIIDIFDLVVVALRFGERV